MSSTFRKILVCLIAVFAVSAVMASTASAKRVWFVNGVQLASGTSNGAAIKVVKSGTTKLKSKEEFVCTEQVLSHNPKIWNKEKAAGEVVGRDEGITEFKKCKNLTNAGCTVTEPIITENTSSEASTLVEKEKGKTPIYDMFVGKGWEESAPTAKKPFAKIVQTGAGCITAITVEGNGVAAEIEPETSSVKKTFKFPCPPISPVWLWDGVEDKLSLKAFGTVKAEFCGSIEVELVSGKTWAVK